MAVDFCDYFWGEEHNGWNMLYQNMKQGLNASKELGEFFKERVSIDEAYCKSLYKLANKANINTEKGTLAPILTLLKVSSEKLSTVHFHMVNKLQDLVKDTFKYNEELHKKQKMVKDEESQMEDVVRLIQATRVLAQKAKEVYHQRCQDQEKLRRDGASTKEMEKVEAKLRKAHDEYKSLVEKYNTIRDDYEKKLIQSCQRFQIVEESHLSQIMLFVQTYIDILQSDKSSMEQIIVELASKYSHLTIDKLLDNFVLSKLTGLEKPVMMVFEDTSSLGSAVSGQQSPEPGQEFCKPSTDEPAVSGAERGLSSGVLTGGFLRSRRDKRKEKKLRRKKESDSSSIKDEKSDNETSEEARTADLILVGDSKFDNMNDTEEAVDDEGAANEEGAADFDPECGVGMEPEQVTIDDDGYTVRPSQKASLKKDNSFDSSSDSDSEIGIEKKIHVKIKPITNGSAPISASVDELRATIEGMSLSPIGIQPYRRSPENPESSTRKANNMPQQMRSSSADLLGLNFSMHSNTESGSPKPSDLPKDNASQTPTNRASFNHSNQTLISPTSLSKANRHSDENDMTCDGSSIDSTPPTLPPRNSVSRESTPNSSIVLPRPSRRIESPLTVSRAESVSSVEFRTSGMFTGLSRGPSPMTIGMADTIPLAVAFQELCHAYFRGTDENRVQIKVTGEMMVSFPAGIVGVLTNNPLPAQLSFKVNNINSIMNVLPNKQLISFDESQSTDNSALYNFNMASLSSLLQKQAEQNPTASYFNVDIIKYQVKSNKAVDSCPLHLVSYWRCEDDHTDLKIDYKYNEKALSTACPLLNIVISVPVDGVVREMHSKPSGQWLKDEQKAVWKITELCAESVDGGKGSLRGKFDCSAGPTTPTTVTSQFNCEGTTLSGLEFLLHGSGYRVSLVKKRFVSGKYICDADAVLRQRYGLVSS